MRKMVGGRGGEVAGDNAPPDDGARGRCRAGGAAERGKRCCADRSRTSGDATPDDSADAQRSPAGAGRRGDAAEADDAAMPADNDSMPDALPEPRYLTALAGCRADAARRPSPPTAKTAAGRRVAPPDETPAGEVLGRYLYKQDVLLRLDRSTGLWRRLPATPSLAAGDRLMALAAFRPTINLIAGVTIQPVDASRFELLGLDEAGVPAIGLDYGRLVLVYRRQAAQSDPHSHGRPSSLADVCRR